MNKTLRNSFIALLAFVGMGSAFAGQPTKVLTFPEYNDEKISAYTKTWTATVDGDVWTLDGFNNNNNGWEFVRCGRKTTAQTAYILSPVVTAAITDVVVTLDKASNLEKVTLTVLNGESVVKEHDITAQFEAGDVDVKVEGASGYSYKLTISTDDKASANGPVQISKVALYEAGQFEEVHIANTPETAYTVAKAYELIDAGQALGETVYVKGIISKITAYKEAYKSIDYWISDDGTTTQQLECYSGKGLNGADFASADDLSVGMTVIVKGTLTRFNDIYEFSMNNEIVSITTGISAIEATSADAPTYNLAGQQVGRDYKGMVIKGGKKLIQK